MAIGETSRERVRKAVEQAFNGAWPGPERVATATEEAAAKGPAQVEAELRDMVEAIVRGVGDGVAKVDADTKQVELVFGLKLKAGLSDAFAMLADLDRKTNVRVKVTFQHPADDMPPAPTADGQARTTETLPKPAGNGSTAAPVNGSPGERSSDAAGGTASAS